MPQLASGPLASGRALASLLLATSIPWPWSLALPDLLEVSGGGREAWMLGSYLRAVVVGAAFALGPRSVVGASWRSRG